MSSVLSEPHFHNEDAAFAYVETHLWPDGRVCPFCGATEEHVGRLKGKTTRVGLCKCYACRKPFTVRIGTIFESSHLALHLWLQAIHLMCSSKKGISTRQLQRTLGVGMKTAWFLGHRIREAMKSSFTGPLGGEGEVLEADETFVGRKPKRKIGRGAGHKHAFFALVLRGGPVRSFHVPNVQANTLRAVLNEDEYVRGSAHTNTIEGYFSIMKGGICGVFHHVSEAHLKRYLVEFDFRYTNREARGIDDMAAHPSPSGARGASGSPTKQLVARDKSIEQTIEDFCARSQVT